MYDWFIFAFSQAQILSEPYVTHLTASPAGSIAPPGRARHAGAHDGAALQILVVEDNADAQYLVCEMLSAFGHTALGTGSAEDALDLLARMRFDVLFSDVSLPGMSGVELARMALRRQSALKVIFASGFGDALLGHVEFPFVALPKPYDLDQLAQALAAIVRQRRGHP